MLPVDAQDHILKRAEIVAIRNALRPAVTLPMHWQQYRPVLRDEPRQELRARAEAFPSQGTR